MLRQYKLSDYRFRLILLVIALSIFGILIIGSANSIYQTRQILGLVLGLAAMVFISLMDYTWILNFYWILYFIGTALLNAVLFLGKNVNGATRWITIAGLQFQPSDIVKILLILFFAKFFENHEENVSKPRIILSSLVLISIQLFLIYKEPDLSTTIAVAAVFCIMIFMAGLSYRIVIGILLVCIPVGVIGMSILLQPDKASDNYQLKRVYAWLRPDEYPQDAMQQQNSIIAIGSGQLYGKGLNNDEVTSVKNGNFIAEAQTDFIFAVAGEETGFVGCCVLVVLEFLIALECLLIGRRAKLLSGTLICCGMAAQIFFQTFINISVATGLMPNTGITLPFVSYGLTSLVSFCIGIGFVLNVGLQTRRY